MTVTVGDIYTAIPSFRPDDMIKLMNGRSDFNGRNTVSLANIASYSGSFAQELSVFTAKKEGKTFTNMLTESKREDVSKAGAIKPENTNQKTEKQNYTLPIAMDTSIFNLSPQKKQLV